ncbi:MAG: hypothetical protein AAFZ15_32415 [Bacteroidota bacterium]
MQISNLFLVQSKNIAIGFSLASWASSKFLAITTLLFVYPALQEWSINIDSPAVRPLVVYAGCTAMYFLIDQGIVPLLNWVFKSNRRLLNRPQRKFFDLVAFILIFKFLATITSSFWAAPEIADTWTSDQEQKETFEAVILNDSLNKSSKEKYALFYQSLLSSETKRIIEAEKKGRQYIERAINDGDRWQRESYKKEGFAWLLNKKNDDPSDRAYAQQIIKARNLAADLIETERKKAAIAANQTSALLNDSSNEKVTAFLIASAEKAEDELNQKKQRRKSYVYIADFVAAFILIFSTYILAVREKAGEVPLKQKNISSILGAFVSKRYDDCLNWLEEFLNVDINGDGYIGNSGKTVVSNRNEQPVSSSQTAIAQTTHQIGFKIPETTVKQPFQKEQPLVCKQSNRSVETVLVADKELRYIKQRLKQAYRRMQTQLDPTTPKNNFNDFKEQLEKAGYTIIETSRGLNIIDPPG